LAEAAVLGGMAAQEEVGNCLEELLKKALFVTSRFSLKLLKILF
jgi:hypothetical protein